MEPDELATSIESRPNRSSYHRGGRWTRLCLKELRETLRDRRTLITLVLMPLLVYPILSMVFQRTLLSAFTRGKQQVVIGVQSAETADFLRERLMMADFYLKQKKQASESSSRRLNGQNGSGQQNENGKQSEAEAKTEATVGLANTTSNASNSFGLPSVSNLTETQIDEISFVKNEDLPALLQTEKIDLGILVPSESESRKFELIYREGSPLSTRALEFVEERLDAMNEFLLLQRLRDVGQPSRLPITSQRTTIQAERRDNTLSTIVPMILILMTVTGAVYPAIDLTAGERERGTLEMLMASPVSRLKLLLAKYVAVVAVAFLTALVNLTAMAITLQATGIGRAVFGDAGLSVVRVAQILGLLVIFAAFFSAVLLALTSFARSFKEAQAYLIPLMLLSLGPGIVSLLPGLQLKGLLAITPISNMVLLARDICNGQVNTLMSWVAILATGLYTTAAVGVAARIFGADAVMTGGQTDLRSLFFASSDAKPANASTVSGALLCLATLFPIYFVTSSFLAQFGDYPIPVKLMISAIATSLLFGAVPGFAAILQRLNLRRAFGLLPAAAAAFTVALLLGFTLWPIAHEIVLFTQRLGLSSITPEMLELAEKSLAELRTTSPLLILLSMAVAPAVFEELFFRGYLFHAFRKASSERTTILVSAALFGLFHVVSKGQLSPERFLPSAFMGLVLGWLCYRSGSVLPGMLLHACHNGFLMMAAYYKDELAAMGIGIEEQAHMPISWIATSVAILLFGIVFIAWLPNNEERYASQSI